MKNINYNTVSTMDLEEKSQLHADSFWVCFVLSGVIYNAFQWWCLIPLLFAFSNLGTSAYHSNLAQKLRDGKYPYPNLNNGVLTEPSNPSSRFLNVIVLLIAVFIYQIVTK